MDGNRRRRLRIFTLPHNPFEFLAALKAPPRHPSETVELPRPEKSV